MNDALAAVVAFLLVSAAPAALAADQKPPRMTKEQAIDRIFQKLDVDKSGAIEAAESDAAAQKRFQRFDADGDGVLTRDEAAAHHAQRSEERRKRAEEWRAKRFAALDADGDGKVTLEEFGARRGQMFARADANGDGKITRDEIASHWQHRHHGKRAPRQ